MKDQERTEEGDTLWYFKPFDDHREDFVSYRFVAPDIALSGEDVALDFDPALKMWHVAQEESELRWEAYGNSQVEAILALIARRYDLEATFEPIPDGSGACDSR
jgi:hypothetical protein